MREGHVYVETAASNEAKPGTCWRCGGLGTVETHMGMSTPCGACLGGTPPEPCPKCRSLKVKCLTYDCRHYSWYCRDCGHEGPTVLDQFKAKELWDVESRRDSEGKQGTEEDDRPTAG